MKLYLSSYKIGNKPEKLLSLLGSGKKVAIIMNALDYSNKARKDFLKDQTEELEKLGLEVEELDLRDYFGKENELEKLLRQKNLVWINGGNTFILRRAMRESGFDNLIKTLVQSDLIVYGGFSAAVCVVTPTLKGLEITDDPNLVPEGYQKEIMWEGLGLIGYSVAVHYKSDHSESHLTDKEIEFYESNGMPYKTLRDGQVLIQDGENLSLVE